MLYVFLNKGYELSVKLEIKKVKNISSITAKEGLFDVLAIQGIAKKDGKIIRTGNISELLPNDKLGNNLKELWGYNQNYSFGTNNQIKVLKEHGIEFALDKRLNIREVIEKLKENHLLIDRGIEFGKRTLINPLPKEILNLAKNLN